MKLTMLINPKACLINDKEEVKENILLGNVSRLLVKSLHLTEEQYKDNNCSSGQDDAAIRLHNKLFNIHSELKRVLFRVKNYY